MEKLEWVRGKWNFELQEGWKRLEMVEAVLEVGLAGSEEGALPAG